MTTLRAIRVPPYTPPPACTIAARAYFLGAGRSRVAMLERFVDREVWAFETAIEERDMPTALIVGMVRGRSNAEMVLSLSALIGYAMSNGVGSRLERFARSHSRRAATRDGEQPGLRVRRERHRVGHVRSLLDLLHSIR